MQRHARGWTGGARALVARAGHPLVLLHGLLDSSAGWDDVTRLSCRPCLAIDLPGFGGSGLPARPRFSAYAEDVGCALDSLGVRMCTLVGHSLGGGVATAVAELMPERIAGLVLLAPVGFGQLMLAELACLPVMRELVVATLPRILRNRGLVHTAYRLFITSPNGPGLAEELRRRLAADSHRSGPGLRAALGALAAASRSTSAFYRRKVGYHGLAWALWGDRDTLVPLAHARGVLAALPQTDLHVWPGMGHHPQREYPGELSQFIEAAATAPHASPVTLAMARRRVSGLGSSPS